MMKNYLYLILTILMSSCFSPEQTDQDLIITRQSTILDISKFNSYGTYFHLDSVVLTENRFGFYFTDTLNYYNPMRHTQNYTLAMLLLGSYEQIPSEIDSIYIKVVMPNRTDGDIESLNEKNSIFKSLKMYEQPGLKNKVYEISKLNKSIFLEYNSNRFGEMLDNLNMYFGSTIDPKSYMGVDSYSIMWEYQYNKNGNFNNTVHLDLFNKILTDTIYIKNKDIGNKLHELIIK